MPYIKISDPNIIDLAAWQQVINVVNQHSDSITAITNNFGIQASGQTDWNGATDIAHEFDPGSQKIIYGKTRIDTASTDVDTIDGTGGIAHIYFGDISFTSSSATAFGAKPIITATASSSSTADNPPSSSNSNVVCTVTAITEDKFTFRLSNARSTSAAPVALTGIVYINWTAIGPK